MVLVAQVLQSKVVAMVHRGELTFVLCQIPGRGGHAPTEALPSKTLFPSCFSHRNDFCEPSLIGSDKMNQVNEVLLFKDSVPCLGQSWLGRVSKQLLGAAPGGP